jgi:hypothetical protein
MKDFLKKRWKLLTVIAVPLLMSFGYFFAKVPQFVNTWYEFWGMTADSVLRMPTVITPAPYRAAGNMYYNSPDSSLYWYTGNQFRTFNNFFNNSGSMYSVDSSYDAQFFVDASAIVYASNAWVLNDTIQWRFLEVTSGHGHNFYDSARGDDVTHWLHLYFPPVRTVFSTFTANDEQLSQRTTFEGASVGFSDFSMPMYVQIPNECVVTGAGGSSWALSGRSPQYFSFSTISGGQANFNITGAPQFYDYSQITFNYIGTNNYHVRVVYSGLGIYNIGFILVDNATGADVTTFPTSADKVIISNAGTTSNAINLLMYDFNNQFLSGTNVNLWVRGLYEVWMTVKYLNSTTAYVRWQLNYPNASTYKIYRANKADFSDQVLVHTGNEGNYTDTGLTPYRTYHYKEVAVVAGVDTYVTNWTMSPR